MIPHSVKDIREVIDGKLVKGSEDWSVEDVVYRLEKLHTKKSMIFLRLKRKVDWDRIKSFSPCVVVTDEIFDELQSIPQCTVILVQQTSKAFWTFVEYYRDLIDIPVVAVTGTCGKTTTKEMITQILSNDRTVQATKGSANSRLQDLPYLLGIDHNTKAAVIETAVGRPGDITEHCRYFKPTIGVITNIGVYHLDGCGTFENYLKAKAEMLDCIDETGVLILNGDDENIKKLKLENCKGRIVRFGIDPSCHYRASNIDFVEGGMAFTLTFEKKNYSVFVPGYGEHQVENALATIAAVSEIGMGIKEAIDYLRGYRPFGRYLELSHGMSGAMILDDTFLTNPMSIEAALKVLKSLAKGRTKIALLGEINRLGDFDEEYHRQIGDMVVKYKVDTLITVGKKADDIGKQAKKKGFKGPIYAFETLAGLYEMLVEMLDSQKILLVKGYGYDRPLVLLTKRLARG
ncbi:UDP-N-acetylmuramoyl-tripeptide--D-alanyl-D-alanine ligase [Bacillaceae bacterium IKA-2]|nr:UDP-N-acetylmuramoyl-tripeptide--D-alanyl-D-alanine ligase [Bacillaceae bacterium IKA-2]